MRVLICSLIMMAGLIGAPLMHGQTIENRRTETKTFKVNPETEIEITNKYGNIHLIPWKKDSIRFEVELVVKGTKQSKVDKSFDYVEFDFKTTKYYIIAQTLFAGKSSFWSDVSDLTGAIFNSSTKTKIDYTVYLPSNAMLKIMNKYGNIYTTDHTGEIEIDLSNGDLKANHFSGKTTISSEFGSVNVKIIDNGRLNINYGELHLDQAGTLDIESKSSKFYIDKADEISLNSRRDKFYIEEIGAVKGISDFSLLEVDQLIEEMNFKTKYGDVDIKSFGDSVESFNLTTDNSDVTLHFIDDKKYKMDFNVTDQTEVLYSAEIKNISSTEQEGDDKFIKVECTVGNDNNKVIPLKMNSKAGSISLKLK